jgi:hypothetical protein
MTVLRIIGSTGDDDLRSDGHAVLRVFLKNKPNIVFDPIFGGQNPHTTFDVTKTLGDIGPNDINTFEIEQVSVENFPETRDNWDMNNVEIQLAEIPNFPTKFPISVARSGFHRFTGSSAVLEMTIGSGLSFNPS